MTDLATLESTDSLTARFERLLVLAGAPRRTVDLFMQLRGLRGKEPMSLRGVAKNISAERVRQLIAELESGPLEVVRTDAGEAAEDLRFKLAEVLRRIESHAPGSDERIRAALAREFLPLDTTPASMVRMADILGVHHGLRLTTWTARAKFADEKRSTLASAEDAGRRRDSVCGIVPDSMPEIFVNFINFARKFSRGTGVIAAGQLAARYGAERGVAVAPNEAVAFLEPFAVHLGRHDGDDWFAFLNSANDFVRKATTRVELFGHCSFAAIQQFHQRYNRSLYAEEGTVFPDSVLRAALELAGFHIEGDVVTPVQPMKGQQGRGISGIQRQMVQVFRDTLKRTGAERSLRRVDLMHAFTEAGIREYTARVYLANQGLFVCSRDTCRLADTELEESGEGRNAGRLSEGRAMSSPQSLSLAGGVVAAYPES